MHNAIIFNDILVSSSSQFDFFIQGKLVRYEPDEEERTQGIELNDMATEPP